MIASPQVFRVTVPSADVATFLEACGAAEWYAFDTGERVMTEEGPDAEAVLLVEPAATTSSRAMTPVLQ